MALGEPTTRLRGMQENDLLWVVELGQNTPEFKTGTEAAQFYSVGTLERWIKDPNGVTLIAEIEGKRTGFLLGYYMEGPNDGYINCIVVDETHRREGVGSALQEKALTEFEKKGPEGHRCNHVFCVVNESDKLMFNLMKKMDFDFSETNFRYVETMLPRRGKEN